MSRFMYELEALAVDDDGDVFERREIEGDDEWIWLGHIDDGLEHPEIEELEDLWQDSQWDYEGQVSSDYYRAKGY